ncbi:alpha/beta hydrolase [Mycobacteroides chelonae]|uniref:Alpha/beta hydrolase n=1 Tax=Mycobacteroides chelonae TaxID=1774 RepID=A0A1S1LX21_MYCCH|nr:alpha/beta fold hydrolase [Mycobacteroides chelonae]OHU28277.1 alpha/beta hydrolase [Mycobacteroides chelonae]OHU63677.1 alpha/beta hydrolase [Mycobacteroides chelonae]OHU76919.1 alpha/beta hydrolase [Mycobacteroides chelonae]QQG88307.1 alpha/beta hydrolase [Mycobacteroides chelonae]QQG93124.1 alpha/beta hydrolase [Mycobacteroides chelonae]
MISIPVSARNLFALTLGDGVRPPTPTSHVALFDEPHRQLRRYGTDDPRESSAVPVLLVPPLAASATCYDLAPGQSLVAHLLEQGRTPYVVDYGEIGWADRHLGLEAFFADIIPQAIERVLIDSGKAQLDLIGWSLGGTLSLLTAAADRGLPIRSIVAIGTPLDYGQIPGYPEARRITKRTNGYAVTTVLRALGGIPAPVVQAAYRATSWDREIKRPWFLLNNLDNTEALAKAEVIDRFQDAFPGYPGRAVSQMWGRFIYHDEIAAGVVNVAGYTLDLTALTLPIQLFGSHRDAIAPWQCVHHGMTMLKSADVRFTTVEASHLGLVALSAGVNETWPAIDEFLAELDGRE